MREFLKNNSKILSLLVIVILFGAIGFAFAYTMEDINIALTTGEYNVVYSGTTTLPSANLQPVVDTEVTSSEDVMKIEFTVKGASTNPTDRDIIYDVALTNLNIPEVLQSHLLKWSLYKNGTQISTGSFSKEFDVQTDNRMILTEIQQDLPTYSETVDSYIFYVWISETCTGDVTTCTAEDDTSALMGQTFSGEIRIELSTKGKKELARVVGAAGETLIRLGLQDSLKTDTPDFTKTSCSSGCGEATVGVYSAEDDLGTSYYFRGDVENNYVLFDNKYWRIVRINGDGTIRMIYDGTSAHANGESSTDRRITTSAFKSSPYNDNTYVGYMYGTAGVTATGEEGYNQTHSNTTDSTIKVYLEDTWYPTLSATAKTKIVDAIYCNDRSLDTSNSSYTGIGTTITYYGAYQRLWKNYTTSVEPILTCPQANDRFTLESTNFEIETNGKLDAPVGLITADEIVMAGGRRVTDNKSYYLYTGHAYWSLSPCGFDGSLASEFLVNASGRLNFGYVRDDFGVRAVVSLSSTAITGGNGTMSSPFTT